MILASGFCIPEPLSVHTVIKGRQVHPLIRFSAEEPRMSPRLWSGDSSVWCSPEVYRGAMPISGLGSVTFAEVVSYEATPVAWLRLQLRMSYAPGASETVSVVPHFCLWRNSGSSALLGHARPWGAPSYSPSLTPHREKRLSAQGRACSFPSWPEAPTGWGAGAPSPWDRTTVLGIGPEWANRRDGWGLFS